MATPAVKPVLTPAAARITETRIALPHGIELNCRVAGPVGAPLLVFVHGFPEAAFVWDELLLHFSAPEHGGYHCIAPNLRGYGGSSSPTEASAYRAKHLTADLHALIEQVATQAGQAAAVIAHDWGGAVAWGLAAQAPDCMAQLAIINAPHPATFLRELQRSPAQQAASAYMNFLARPDAPARLAEDDFRRLWAFFDRMGASTGPHAWLTPALRERYRAAWSQGLHGPCHYYTASPLRPPTADRDSVSGLVLPPSVCQVNVPTQVIWGLNDTALPPQLLEGLAGWVPQLRVDTVADATHWIIHEQPQRVIALLSAFLDT